MRIAGIICECNPPHAGHFYLLEQARHDGADVVLCLMSGCFVQRGEAAVLDAYARAEILMGAGADAVFELPMPYSASSAEYFGGAGVDILKRLGITELWFGSESGELTQLMPLSELAETEAFVARYRAHCASGMGTAQAYFQTLTELGGEDAKLSPNDILALSYLRAIKRTGGDIRPVAIKRMGSGYHERTVQSEAFPSATALRLLWTQKGAEAVLEYLPQKTAEILQRETVAGRAPARLECAERMILGSLRLADAKALSSLAGLGGGLASRLVKASRTAANFEELMRLLATKTYPDAALRRAILYALLGVTEEDLRAPAAYVRLLAANARGCEQLAAVRRTGEICVVTRMGDLPSLECAERQLAIEEKALLLYTMMLPAVAGEKRLLCHPPLIF